MTSAKQWTPFIPVPKDTPAPRFDHQVRGTPKEIFHFRDQADNTLGYVCTFYRSTGEKIQQTLTWCSNAARERAWRWVQFPSLRPLYGLHRLTELAAPYPVMLTFDCASADAAREWMPHYASLAWVGGVRKIDDVDFSPLRGRMVWIVPDAGTNKARAKIAKILRSYAAGVIEVDVSVSADMPEGWNFGVAFEAGWTAAQAEALITGNTLPNVHAEKKKTGPLVLAWKHHLRRAGHRMTPTISRCHRSFGATANCRASSMRPRPPCSRATCACSSAVECWRAS